MRYYDFFSTFYDSSTEKLYVEQHVAAAEALKLEPGSVVLDVPCGTGHAFDTIVPRIRDGLLVGVDLSSGMLARARKRAAANGWSNVRLGEASVLDVDTALVESVVGRSIRIDRLHVFLGLTAFPEWETAFERLWQVLAPGGRCVVVDVHAERYDFRAKMTNFVARADVRREFWGPLERVASGYSRTELPSLPAHGGKIFLASGTK